MSAMSAVVVNGISKKYKLYQQPSDRLKEWLSPKRAIRHREFWALKDVTFELPKGSALGVIGPNGAGKSTLLKILTGTTIPTEGTYSLIGRVASLLELGAGFHPEFTGRQNLRMNARMLGLTDEEIQERMDEIVDFAELKAFIDQPVRTYSSGMYVRLGFAIASSVSPDVLIVDEALSVGDAYFQRKSIDRIQYFRDHGVTILFVSHDLSIVRRFCDQALWLNEGRVQNMGDVHRVSKSYELWERKKEQVTLGIEYQLDDTTAEPVPDGSGVTSREQKKKLRVLGSTWGSGEVKITRVEMLGADGKSRWSFNTGEPVTLRYHFYAFREVATPIFGLNIHRLDGVYVFGTNNHNIHPETLPPLRPGQGYVDFHIKELKLHNGTYFLTVNVYTKPDEPFWSEPADFHNQMYEFKVWSEQPQHGVIPLDGGWQIGQERLVTQTGAVPSRLDFASDQVVSFLYFGWHEVEETLATETEPSYPYVWATPKAEFLIHVPQDAQSVFLDISGNFLEKPEGQLLTFTMEGEPLGTSTVTQQGYATHALVIPDEMKGRTVRVCFQSDQSWTPKSLFGGDDERQLSVSVRGIWVQ